MRQIPSVYSELNLVEGKVQKIIDKNFNRLSPLLYKLLLDWFISAFSNFKDSIPDSISEVNVPKKLDVELSSESE